MLQRMTAPEQPPVARAGTRRVIHASCTKHGGARKHTNLVMTKNGGEIMLDPHVTGQCVLTLDEAEAAAMRDALTEWLG